MISDVVGNTHPSAGHIPSPASKVLPVAHSPPTQIKTNIYAPSQSTHRKSQLELTPREEADVSPRPTCVIHDWIHRRAPISPPDLAVITRSVVVQWSFGSSGTCSSAIPSKTTVFGHAKRIPKTGFGVTSAVQR